MKKNVLVIGILGMMLFAGACGEKNGANATEKRFVNSSDESTYLVGARFGAGVEYTPLGEYLEEDYVITRDGHFLVVYWSNDRERLDIEERVVIDKELSQEKFDTISELYNKTNIKNLDMKESTDVCDGDSKYLLVYNDENKANSYGGYMPQNEQFLELFRLIGPGNLDKDDYRILGEVYDELEAMWNAGTSLEEE